jgi:hypothetical protein
VGLAPGGCRLAGANLLSNGPSNLHGGSDGKTALQSGKHEDEESWGGELEPASEQRPSRVRRAFSIPRERFGFAAIAAREAASVARTAVDAATIAVGVTISSYLAFIKDSPAWGAFVLVLAALLVVVEGGFRLRRRELAEASAARAKIESERDDALRRISELQAPADDPDPRLALANRAEHRAAQLRGVCASGEGRMSSTRILRESGLTDPHGDREQGDALAEYERDHSIETRSVFDQLVAEGLIDAERRPLIESPRFLDDLRTAAALLEEAAARLRAGEQPSAAESPADEIAHRIPPTAAEEREHKRQCVARLRKAYQDGKALQPLLIRGEGAATSAEESEEYLRRAKAKAREWASATWEMLVECFPAYEQEFFGPNAPALAALGPQGFWMSADEEMRWTRPEFYVGAKLEILGRLLAEVDR